MAETVEELPISRQRIQERVEEAESSGFWVPTLSPRLEEEIYGLLEDVDVEQPVSLKVVSRRANFRLIPHFSFPAHRAFPKITPVMDLIHHAANGASEIRRHAVARAVARGLALRRYEPVEPIAADLAAARILIPEEALEITDANEIARRYDVPVVLVALRFADAQIERHGRLLRKLIVAAAFALVASLLLLARQPVVDAAGYVYDTVQKQVTWIISGTTPDSNKPAGSLLEGNAHAVALPAEHGQSPVYRLVTPTESRQMTDALVKHDIDRGAAPPEAASPSASPTTVTPPALEPSAPPEVKAAVASPAPSASGGPVTQAPASVAPVAKAPALPVARPPVALPPAGTPPVSAPPVVEHPIGGGPPPVVAQDGTSPEAPPVAHPGPTPLPVESPAPTPEPTPAPTPEPTPAPVDPPVPTTTPSYSPASSVSPPPSWSPGDGKPPWAGPKEAPMASAPSLPSREDMGAQVQQAQNRVQEFKQEHSSSFSGSGSMRGSSSFSGLSSRVGK